MKRIALVVIGLAAASFWSDRLAARYLSALAGSTDPQKSRGLAIQRLAFQRDDLLPLYGASEVARPSPGRSSTATPR